MSNHTDDFEIDFNYLDELLDIEVAQEGNDSEPPPEVRVDPDIEVDEDIPPPTVEELEGAYEIGEGPEPPEDDTMDDFHEAPGEFDADSFDAGMGGGEDDGDLKEEVRHDLLYNKGGDLPETPEEPDNRDYGDRETEIVLEEEDEAKQDSKPEPEPTPEEPPSEPEPEESPVILIAARVTAQEKEKAQALAAALGLNLSDLIRILVSGKFLSSDEAVESLVRGFNGEDVGDIGREELRSIAKKR